MIELKTKRITVTGGKGFLGAHLLRQLREERGCRHVQVADLPEFDLREIGSIRKMFVEQKPEIVIQDEGLDLAVTISLGVATYPEHGESAEEIIIKADKALYHSKATGRNRVTVWEEKMIEENRVSR